ncbi:MAG TPA: hypothetical protein VHX88_08965 [Solirubrobacteraceae bacterium]|jgi:oxaloacetate decarboxylase alpha subunit|nr:hypothetical protein [Solirubrobacteraceae bacterium]
MRPHSSRNPPADGRLVTPIEFVDQTLRDGQQSLWGMRMRAGHILSIAPVIDAAGYRAVDLTGSSMFEVLVRYRREDPWRGLDAIRAAFPDSPLRAGTRPNGVVGMGITPDSVIELWVRTLARHGIRSLWLFDCLHNVEHLLKVADVARSAGVAPSPQINFSFSPVHTDEYYAGIVRRMVAGGDLDTIILGDEAGVLGPERARHWVRLIREGAPGVPLELHFHNRTAMANLNHIIGVQEGATILHTAVSTMANGVSMPSTEVTIDNMRRLGHEVAIDDSRLADVAAHFGALADQEGFPRGAPVEYEVAAIQQQFPGGMMGTLREQLAQVGMTERLPALLEESIRVREELGWPIMATPFSQLVGIQALLHVTQEERWATIPDETMMYLAGWYGTPPGPVAPELLDRVSSTPRGRAILAADGPPQPSIAEIRRDYGPHVSDEELLLRYLIAGPDVDAMYAAKAPIEPIRPRPAARDEWLADLLRGSRARAISVRTPGLQVSLRR